MSFKLKYTFVYEMTLEEDSYEKEMTLEEVRELEEENAVEVLVEALNMGDSPDITVEVSKV